MILSDAGIWVAIIMIHDHNHDRIITIMNTSVVMITHVTIRLEHADNVSTGPAPLPAVPTISRDVTVTQNDSSHATLCY